MINFHSIADPKNEAGSALGQMIMDRDTKPTLLFLSGGSSISFLDNVPLNVLRPTITITTLDERFSTDPEINTFLQIQKTHFYEAAILRNVHCIESIPRTDESLEAFALRQSNAIEKWIEEHPDGHVIATVGVGHNGHVAGIFPMEEARFNETYGNNIVTPVVLKEGEDRYRERISVTPWFMTTHIHTAVVFALGEQKREIFAHLNAKRPFFELPASLLAHMPQVEVFSDSIS